MKKTICERSIFAVIACIALAVSLTVGSVKVIPVTLDPDVQELVGEEAGASFSAFFNDLQIWYQSYKAPEDGVELKADSDYEKLSGVIDSLMPYLEAEPPMETEEDVLFLQEYNMPLAMGTMVLVNMLVQMEMTGSCALGAEDWSTLGTLIDQMVEHYQLG